jgi:hypothetical protein
MQEFQVNFVNITETPQHVMVDLETFDTVASAVILSIGACTFDKNGIWSKFYVVIKPESCIDLGMTVSEDTQAWWLKQSPEARVILDPDTPKVTIQEGLTMFSDWFKRCKGKELWGNGADFDNAILAFAYGKMDADTPWKFSDSRCFRTIKNGKYMFARKGVYHNALDDAITQAQYMVSENLIPERISK